MLSFAMSSFARTFIISHLLLSALVLVPSAALLPWKQLETKTKSAVASLFDGGGDDGKGSSTTTTSSLFLKEDKIIDGQKVSWCSVVHIFGLFVRNDLHCDYDVKT
mmetsp:Transcript_30078/g.55351  ORF Transcript_30078/g.55351 Transcript_30078/m.55351 type:complete len:106 (+) Transcript_30078:177-494(+)